MNDRQRFDALASRCRSSLKDLAYSLTGNPEDAQDLLQDTLVKAWCNFAVFDPERGPFNAFCVKIMRSACVDLWRKRRVRIKPVFSINDESQADLLDINFPDTEVSRQPEAALMASELTEEISQAVSHLSPNMQRAVLLRAQQLEYHEIAEQIGCPLGTVRTRIHRGRLRAAQWLSENYPWIHFPTTNATDTEENHDATT